MERASVRRRRVKRARSNKYSGGDSGATPKSHTRKSIWVGGYRRGSGKQVKGYYRANAQFKR